MRAIEIQIPMQNRVWLWICTCICTRVFQIDAQFQVLLLCSWYNILCTHKCENLYLSLSPPSLLGFNNAALTTAAKDREAKAKKRYGKMKKDPSPKLYDKPPNLR